MVHILLLFLVLTSCGSRHVDDAPLLPELQQAEELMFPHPDSALHVLQRMPVPSERDQYQHATWALLLSHALYKNYIKQNDSLVNIACDYFLPRDDAGRKGLALYVKGCIYDEANRQDEALPLLLQASDEIAKTTDYRLGHLNERVIGTIYSYRVLYDYALAHLNKALDYALQANESLYIAASYRYLARIPDLKGDYQESIALYKKGIDLVPSGTNAEARLYFEIASVFMHAKDYQSALKYALESTKINEGKYISDQAYSVLGETYYHLGMNDSAQYYMKKITESSNIYTARGANRLLRKISEENLDFKSADNYADKLIILLDSIRFIDRNEAILEIQEKYNKEVLINEKNQIQLKRERDVRISLVVIIALLVIIGIGTYWYWLSSRRKERLIAEQEKQIHSYSIRIAENEGIMARNLQQIAELTDKLKASEDAEGDRNGLQAEIDRIKNDDERLRLESANMRHALVQCVDQLVKQTDVLNRLRKEPKLLKPGQLQEVEEKVNYLFDRYGERLRKFVPSLSDSELQTCCLIKMGLGVSDMAQVLSISPTSVSKRKNRIKEQIVRSTGSTMEKLNLDLWLRTF